jgi:hypothetical protein
MFAKLSLNQDKPEQKKRNEFSIVNQRNQFEYGKPEWNQETISTNKQQQNDKKNVKNLNTNKITYIYHLFN